MIVLGAAEELMGDKSIALIGERVAHDVAGWFASGVQCHVADKSIVLPA